MAIIDKVFAALKDAGIDARKPAMHPGECKAPYVVVQDFGQMGGRAIAKQTVALHCYAPNNPNGELAPLIHEVARTMTISVPALRPEAKSEEAINDELMAVTASLTYTALCAR